MQFENEKLYTMIYEKVQETGISPNISGCKYIACAIYYIFQDPSLTYQIMFLYKKIALQYDTTYTAVEHCIRHAISSLYRFHPELLKKVVTLTTRQPQNSEFICGLADKIRLQIKMENQEL